MNGFVCFGAAYFLNSLWQAPLFGGMGWLASRMLKRLGPQAQHAAWVATLGLTILIPGLPLFHLLTGFASKMADTLGRSSIALIVLPSGVDGKDTTIFPEALVLALFWFGVCALLYFVARLSLSFYRTTALLRNSSPATLSFQGDEIWSDCKQVFALEDAVIKSSGQIYGPVTLGFFGSVLLIPDAFSDRCTSSDFLTALGHECAHMKRRDFQKNLIYEIASLAIAFHPVTWMLKSKIAETREMICDAMAIKKLIDPHSYAQSLLRLATTIAAVSQANTSHAIGIFDANILEERIMLIRTKEQNPSRAARCGLPLCSTLLLFSAAAGAAGLGVDIKPPIKAQAAAAEETKASGHVYSPGGEVSPPRLISAPDPIFPRSAHNAKGPFTGFCVLKLVVDSTGKPGDIQIVRSLGPDFDESAINAVKQYRFSPAKREGVAVPVAVHIEVNFRKY